MSRFARLDEDARFDDPAISRPTPCRHRETAHKDAITLKNGTRTFYCTDCNRLVFRPATPEDVAAADRGDSRV